MQKIDIPLIKAMRDTVGRTLPTMNFCYLLYELLNKIVTVHTNHYYPTKRGILIEKYLHYSTSLTLSEFLSNDKLFKNH